MPYQGQIQYFPSEGCTTMKWLQPHLMFLFWQNTTYHRKPQVIWGGGVHSLHSSRKSDPAYSTLHPPHPRTWSYVLKSDLLTEMLLITKIMIIRVWVKHVFIENNTCAYSTRYLMSEGSKWGKYGVESSKRSSKSPCVILIISTSYWQEEATIIHIS